MWWGRNPAAIISSCTFTCWKPLQDTAAAGSQRAQLSKACCGSWCSRESICLWKHGVLGVTTWAFLLIKKKVPMTFFWTWFVFWPFLWSSWACWCQPLLHCSQLLKAEIGFSLKFAYQCIYTILLKARYSTGVVCWASASHTTLYFPDNTMWKAKNGLLLNRRCYLLHTQLWRRGYFSMSLPSLVTVLFKGTNIML